MNLIEIPTHPNQHWYELDGEHLPSVTTILSAYPKGEGFARWLASQGGYEQALQVRDEAGDRGTKVHKAVEALLNGEEYNYHKDVEENHLFNLEQWKMIESFVRWYEDQKPESIWVEKTVYSKEHKYAGTADYLCKIGEEIVLVDFKTSSKVYPSHRLQVQAYARALSDSGERVDNIAILRLGSRHKAGYEFVSEPVSESEFNIFLATYELWKHDNPKLVKNCGPSLTTIRDSLTL